MPIVLHFSCACLKQVEAESRIKSKHFVHPSNQDESGNESKHFDESRNKSKHFVHPSNQESEIESILSTVQTKMMKAGRRWVA
jgi:hypothetical protein